MTSDGRESFASQLVALRSHAGLSLGELGAAAHLARGYIHHIEHGRRWPSCSVAAALDSALNANGALLAVWKGADNTVRLDRTAATAPAEASRQPGDAEPVLVSAADELAGPFTCSVDRAGGFWSDVYLASPSTR
ncbi:MAG: helix-turn-helix domain-containing protein [Pseudonocardiaceae bacterium]